MRIAFDRDPSVPRGWLMGSLDRVKKAASNSRTRRRRVLPLYSPDAGAGTDSVFSLVCLPLS